LLFYAESFVFYNLALSYTTVGRGTLALSTLPLMTMLVGWALRLVPLTWRKSWACCSPWAAWRWRSPPAWRPHRPGAWRGDLIMAGTTLCMAFYSVYACPLIARSSALGFLAAGIAHEAERDQRGVRREGAALTASYPYQRA
jgi:drug/metabolite transporter (DMT)-like permease